LELHKFEITGDDAPAENDSMESNVKFSLHQFSDDVSAKAVRDNGQKRLRIVLLDYAYLFPDSIDRSRSKEANRNQKFEEVEAKEVGGLRLQASFFKCAPHVIMPKCEISNPVNQNHYVSGLVRHSYCPH
jgi:hypothetical protein